MSSMEVRFRAAGRSVPLPTPWDLNVYLARVAAYRGRSLSVHTVPAQALAGHGCRGAALWIARAHDDIIVYDGEATDRNADHLVLHQIGHLLLGHGEPADARRTGGPAPERAVPPALALHFPSLSVRSAEQVAGRDGFPAEYEQEAEVFADMTMVYANLPRKRKRSLFRRR